MDAAAELERLRSALNASDEIAYDWDLLTDRFRFFGQETPPFGGADIATGREFNGLVNPEDLVQRLDMLARHHRAREPYDCEYRIRIAGGEQRWVHDRGRAEFNAGGQPVRMSGTMRFVTSRKQTEAELKYLANHDDLTGHFNRARLRDALDQALKYSARYGVSGAYLVVGIDKLTMVNAAFGHETADTVILAVGRRLEESLRACDAIGRVGGDRFGIVLTNCPDAELARACEKTLDAVRAALVETAFGPIHVTVSIGAVEFPGAAHTTGDTMTKAEIALENAKRAGRDCFAIYAYSDEERRGHRHSIVMAEQVKTALRENRLRLAYQPIVDARTREPVYYECLMRKVNGDGEIMPAASFMPAVEQLGLIRVVDRKALELAVDTLGRVDDVTLAINVSGMTATDRFWLRGLVSLLRGKPEIASRLVVEITETAALDDIDECARFVISLKDLGCRVALDDFGAGYTSFSQLKMLAVDMIKIDGSFVRQVCETPENLVFIRTLLELAQNLDLKTVAECVETAAEAELLSGEGVDYLQGYAFGAPTIEPDWALADSGLLVPAPVATSPRALAGVRAV
jgi:diguanylate cyclase (GGDEF)-like protein